MKKYISLSVLFILGLFVVRSVVFAQVVSPSLSDTPTISIATSPTSTNKLLSQAQHKEIQTENLQERVVKIQERANTLITERISAINATIARIQANEKLMTNTNSQAQAQSIIARLQNDSSELTALDGQIQSYTLPAGATAETIPTQLFPLVQKIFTEFRIYAEELPYANSLSHSLLVSNLLTQAAIIATNMQNDITYAQSQQISTTNIDLLGTDLATYNTDRITLTSDTESVTTTILGISPSAYPGNEAAIHGLLPKFQKIHADVMKLASDYKMFATDFKNAFGINTSATPTPSM